MVPYQHLSIQGPFLVYIRIPFSDHFSLDVHSDVFSVYLFAVSAPTSVFCFECVVNVHK